MVRWYPGPWVRAQAAVSVAVAIVSGSCIRDLGGADPADAGVADDVAGRDAVTEAGGDTTRDATGIGEGGDLPPFENGPNPATIPVYDPETIVAFEVLMSEDDWRKIEDVTTARAVLRSGAERYVHCTFRFGSETFEDAACRRKGNDLDWDLDIKPQVIIRFNKWDPDGRFRGLRRLNLEATAAGVAPVRDRLGMWLMREAGVDAPRVNHATLKVNGVDYGLYMNIEPIDREFLEDHFENPDGDLYADGNELVTNEGESDKGRLHDLKDLVEDEAEEGDHEEFYEELAELLDIDQVLRENAAEAVLPTCSNFTNGYNNFYLYDDPVSGFRVLPWDLDRLLTDSNATDTNPFEAPAKGLLVPDVWRLKLRRLMLRNPAWRAKYEDLLVEIRDGAYARLAGEVTRVCAGIRQVWMTDARWGNDVLAFDQDCAGMKDRIHQRIAFLKQVLRR